jgi:hypothetical protein
MVEYQHFRGSGGPPKFWYPTTTLHGITTQKTSICNCVPTLCNSNCWSDTRFWNSALTILLMDLHSGIPMGKNPQCKTSFIGEKGQTEFQG